MEKSHPEKAVACLLAGEFEDSEFRVPYDRLREAGYRVDVVGTHRGDQLKGHKGKESVKVDKAIGSVKVDGYEGLLIPGGHSPDQLRADERFVSFVKDFDKTGRPIAAVCHGPQLLMAAGLVKGRTLTAWTTIQSDLRQMGAKVKDQEVVVDDNWITSRKPDDLEAFSAKFVEELHEEEERHPSAGLGADAQPGV
ncbi:MAG TPA: type 1 glutamine amidotransferase domain-containing protein [Polyangia bacterium]|jgi:protease I|nr:type 1 glutamine amidotransferase domain-containing protein [Polyangia bacterium]